LKVFHSKKKKKIRSFFFFYRRIFITFCKDFLILIPFAIKGGDKVDEDVAGDAEFIFKFVVLLIKRTIGG
jgi:hypothetical protein